MKEGVITEVDEQKFTLSEAVDELNNKGQKFKEDREARLQEASELIQAALDKTNCSLTVDPNSALNNLAILVTANKEEH